MARLERAYGLRVRCPNLATRLSGRVPGTKCPRRWRRWMPDASNQLLALENRVRQREYNVSKLLRAKEQPVSLMSSHNLVTQNCERQRSFARIPRYNLKSLRSLLGSLRAQLYGLFCVAGAEREMQSPFR